MSTPYPKKNRLKQRPNPNESLTLLKNSQAWFQFVEKWLEGNPCLISINRDSPSRIAISVPSSNQTPFQLALVSVNEEGLNYKQPSGVPSTMIETLDKSMRELRESDRETPLAAYLKPENYWTRGPAWLLGEYLAERDLLLWVDLLHLHPERAVAWVRLLVDCGLACPRTIVSLERTIEPEDLPLLKGSGTWLVQTAESMEKGRLHQV